MTFSMPTSHHYFMHELSLFFNVLKVLNNTQHATWLQSHRQAAHWHQRKKTTSYISHWYQTPYHHHYGSSELDVLQVFSESLPMTGWVVHVPTGLQPHVGQSSQFSNGSSWCFLLMRWGWYLACQYCCHHAAHCLWCFNPCSGCEVGWQNCQLHCDQSAG